jgi:hypothetical protein
VAVFAVGCGDGDTSTSTESASTSSAVHDVAVNGGVLTLTLPQGFRAETLEVGSSEPAQVELIPPTPDGLHYRMTVLGADDLMPNFGTEAGLREKLDTWAKEAASILGTQDGPTKAWSQNTTHGVYLTASDSAAAANEPARLINGYFNLDGCVVMLGGAYRGAPRDDATSELLGIAAATRWEPVATQ